MASPLFTIHTEIPLVDRFAMFLPQQGSFEVQHDQPAKVHSWHMHSVTETLFVLAGDVELFWCEGGVVKRRKCESGTRIELPAQTLHGSIAGAEGCTYFIAPEGGATAVTTFLSAEEWPDE